MGTRSAPSAATRSRPLTASSPATRPEREAAVPAIAGEMGLLAGLGRPGEVQGTGAEPDRSRLEGHLSGRRWLRPRSAPRREAGKGLGVGVDGDQSFLGPHVLTSALKGVDSAVFLTVKAVHDGTSWAGRTSSSGSTGGLGSEAQPQANAEHRRPSRCRAASPTARSRTSRRPSSRAGLARGPLEGLVPDGPALGLRSLARP